MRGALLVVVLVSMVIVAYMWASYTQPVGKASKQAREQVNQIAGRNSAGVQAGTMVKYAPVERNGHITGLTIKSIDPSDGLAEHFGLVAGDTVLHIGPFDMGDNTLSDEESARIFLVDAMQRNYDIVVDRGGTQIKLPAQRNFLPPAGGGGGSGATPGNPSSGPQ
jgi:hypothetical protein